MVYLAQHKDCTQTGLQKVTDHDPADNILPNHKMNVFTFWFLYGFNKGDQI